MDDVLEDKGSFSSPPLPERNSAIRKTRGEQVRRRRIGNGRKPGLIGLDFLNQFAGSRIPHARIVFATEGSDQLTFW